MSDARQRLRTTGSKVGWTRRITAQVLGILGMGTLLGLAFNASNPVGIRFTETVAPEAASPGLPKSPVQTVTSNGLIAKIEPVSTPPIRPVVVTPGQGIPAQVDSGAKSAAVAGTSSAPVVVASPQNPSATTWAKTEPLALAGACVLVDARSSAAYDAGHIPGAISLPQTSTDDEVKGFVAKHATNTHLVVYCSSTSCSLSYKLAARLVNDFKFQNVEYMTGGYMEWQRATGLAVDSPPAAASTATGTSVAPAANSGPTLPDMSAMGAFRPVGIRTDEISTSFPGELPQMVDIRSDEEFGRGHIDGAVRADLAASEAEVVTLFKRLGADRPLIVYCEQSGCLDAVRFGTRLRLAGFKQVRYLEDGYRGWAGRQVKK